MRRLKPAFVLLLFFSLTFFGAVSVFAESPAASPQQPQDEITKQIEAKNQEIKQLEAEAAKYRTTLGDIGKEANTLATRIRSLDRAIAGLKASIQITSAKIARTNLEIQELGKNIRAKETSIETERGHLGSLLISVAEGDHQTPLEILMKNETLSSFFTSIDALKNFQEKIQSLLAELRQARQDLKNQKTQAEQKKLELVALSNDLKDQKNLQEYERTERANLLKETKNQERKYQELLAEVERKRQGLQQEINTLEAGLRATFDRSLLPKAGVGILGWPLPDPIFITQYFGNTAFARAGGYNGKGHNGIDLRAANGTPIFAGEGGVVRATGNTDASCRRASYGNWVLIDHPNNLSTLYAHLSLIKVAAGDGVNRGELIAYSGHTGYATGPHLHLSVFARQAVELGQLRSRICGTIMTLPLSPFSGYLNPTDYLPGL